MSAPETTRSLEAHKRWLGYLQPDGLVVSAAALVDRGHYYNEAQRQRQIEFIDHLREYQNYDEENGTVKITDFKTLATGFLEWPAQEWVEAAELPDRYHLYLKESTEVLSPLAALHLPRSQRQGLSDDQSPYQLLLFSSGHPEGDFDKPYEVIPNTWFTSATRRFERLLRETGVPAGLLVSKTAVRLVHAPQGENPGHLTFRYADMLSTMGRPILGAFELLLGRDMLFLGEAKNQLPALLRHSRSMQASVSSALAEQVLEALYELVRGFQAADSRVHGDLLRSLMARNPDEVYHGQLTVLLRLVFLLFAEDRGLLPSSPLFTQHYSLHSLFERLNRDAALHHDTMDQRFGAWPQLLTLFRLIHAGHRHRDLEMPAREGHLFDPDRFPFLEGRTHAREDVSSAANRIPTVADGVIWRILGKLLILRGERLSYRTLDVEQIGSVYQTMIGFTLEVATGTSIALKPAKSKGAPAFINLDTLLATPSGKRAEFLQKNTDHKLTGRAATALKDATTHDDLLAALDRKIARQASPEKLPSGSYLLQPTDERRRSGSHYTPRALTAPIVKKTLEPILARLTSQGSSDVPPASSPSGEAANSPLITDHRSLGTSPTPQQILDLKVCDPAVGSGAFLVEACRQLGDALVAAWTAHGGKPVIPPDEDELLHARRLVAQRCLYREDQIADHLIREPRLSRRVAEYLNQAFKYTLADVELRRPPRMRESTQHQGLTPLVTGWKFPEWFVVQKIENHGDAKARRLVGKHLLENNGKYRDVHGTSHKVVPIRFVRACKRGHVDDIDWLSFVHNKVERNCPKAMQGLYFVERGNSGALSEIFVSCDCGASRSLAAAQKDQQSLGNCSGRRPWLGPLSRESCGQPSRLLVRSASNAYFPQLYSVISIPERSSALAAVLQKFENDLLIVTGIEILSMARKMNGALNASLGDRSDEEVFEALQTLRSATPQQDVGAKTLEFLAFTGPEDSIAKDQHDGDFLIRHLPPELWKDDPLLADCLQQIVLVERLREVTAQVGFTRFESPGKRLDGELDMELDITPAPLAKDKINIIPAFENRGEGFFLHFNPGRIHEWMGTSAVMERAEILRAGYASYADAKGRNPDHFFGAAYYLLHTFSHLLIQQISLECGYPTSSIKERIYCNPTLGHYGILLYTGTQDAEGTLGGLVEAAKSIRGLFHSTLGSSAICSADPVCSHAKPDKNNPSHWLLGSACHCCTHLPETCCEQMNQYLDRALVLPTLEDLKSGFFPLAGT